MDRSESREELYAIGVPPRIGSHRRHQLLEDREAVESFTFSNDAGVQLPLAIFSQGASHAYADACNSARAKYSLPTLPVPPVAYQNVALSPVTGGDFWPASTHPLGLYRPSWSHGLGYPGLLPVQYAVSAVKDSTEWSSHSGSYKEEDIFQKASSAFDGHLVSPRNESSSGQASLNVQVDGQGGSAAGSWLATSSSSQRRGRDAVYMSVTEEDGVSVDDGEGHVMSDEETENTMWKDAESTGTESDGNEGLVIDIPSSSKPTASAALDLSHQSDVTAMTIPRKRRKINDESEVRRPLDVGWGRQVRLKHLPNGVCKSEVFYVAPCGKKLRTYPDVSRYLQRTESTDLMLSDFSFSAKVFLGDFFESSGGEYEKVSDKELNRRRQANQEAKKEREAKLTPKRKKQEKDELDEEVERQSKRKLKVEEAKGRREERNMQKATKEQCKRVMEEEKMKRKQEMAMQRLEDAARKAREKELKRQQMAFQKEMKRQEQLQAKERQRAEMATVKAQEKELKRQQAIALRTEEAHRRALAREKLREDKEAGKQRLKELKAERRQLTAAMMNDLLQPCDDLLLRHPRTLPSFNAINCSVSAVAFGHILMVVEFLWTFSDAFNIQDLPTVGSLQAGLFNRHSHRESLIDICLCMLEIIIHDSNCGVHHAVTPMGTFLSSVDITDKTFSEALRIVLEAKGSGGLPEVVSLLASHPFLSLTADHKAAILAFLVNELLSSRVVLQLIDLKQGRIAELRRFKWKIQRKLRQVRQAMNERFRTEPSPEGKHTGRKTKTALVTNEGDDEDEEEEDGSDDDNDVEDDSEGLSDIDMNEVEATNLPESKEELEQEATKLQRWQQLYRRKLHAAIRSMRCASFGVDRYSRHYWSLPHCGGVFVEGIDSAEVDNDVWWIQSHHVTAAKSDTPVETKLKSIPPLIKLPVQTGLEKYRHDSHHYHRNHRLKQVRFNRYQRGTTSPSKDGSLNTHLSDNGSENEGGNPAEGKLLSPYGRMSSYNPFSCDVTWLHSELKKDPLVARPVPVWPSLSQVKSSIEGADGLTSHCGKSDPGSAGSDELSLLAAVATSQQEHEHQRQQQGDSHSFDMADKKDMRYSSGLITPSVLTLASETLKAVKAAEKAKPQNHKTPSLHINQLTGTSGAYHNEVMTDSYKVQQPPSVSKDMDHGWWMITKGDEMRSVFKSLCTKGFRENSLRKALCKNLEYACRSCGKGAEDVMIPEGDSDHSEDDGSQAKLTVSNGHGKEDGVDYPNEAQSAFLVLLNDIEELEDRLLSASLQSKGWKPRSSGEDDGGHKVADYATADECLRNGSLRLLALEEAIERRYLKPPLRDVKPLTSSALNARLLGCGDEEDSVDGDDRELQHVPLGLIRWREAVRRASSAAQMVLCCNQLEKCIAWEKSIMKVFCQVCLKGDNEALLLLCDGCEKGVHSYCCKPKLSGIPDGDWYCHMCVQNAAGDRCSVCSASSTTGRMIQCGHCTRQYHMRCLDPPMSRPPKDLWCCPICKKQLESSRVSAEQLKLDVDDLIQQANARPAKRSRGGGMAACRALLRDLEKQSESWPFLTPVVKKQVPSYYQIIKNPMDFQTVRNKMKGNQYPSREAFAADIRLIFANCRTFNEDDSEVGKSGIALGQYFEKQWQDINR